MCRFILVKSRDYSYPKEILVNFSDSVEKSRTPDGDLQEDGWGHAWIDDQNTWQVYKSINPIWKESKKFSKFPKTKIFLSHARSASFVSQKGFIEFNQPYISKDYAFVFNGLLKGVSLLNVPGKIGAEKIWYLLRQELKNKNPQKALENIRDLLLKSTKEIVALNIGLADKENICSLNYFTQFPKYYQLYNQKNNSFDAISSIELSGL